MIESWEAGRACPVRGDRRSPPVADGHPRYGAQLSLTTSVGGNTMFGVSVPRLTRSTKSAEAEVDLTQRREALKRREAGETLVEIAQSCAGYRSTISPTARVQSREGGAARNRLRATRMCWNRIAG